MLNKEMLMAGASGDSSVLMVVGEYVTDDLGQYGWRPYREFGSIRKVPYWGESTLTSIYYTEDGIGGYDSTEISFSKEAPYEIKVKINDSVMVCSPNDKYNYAYDDVFNLKNSVNKEVLVAFTPPPYRVSRSRDREANLGRENLKSIYGVEEGTPWGVEDAE